MKYMGSKRTMLRNGLGKLLLEEAPRHVRFIDLFSGSAAVATFVATNVSIPVHTYDLQHYGRILAGAVVERTSVSDYRSIWKNWRARALRHLNRTLRVFGDPPRPEILSKHEVLKVRKWCENVDAPLTRAYGGHYYSATQSLWLDALRASLCDDCSLELASLVDAASECAASPGHTAQPFQPTETAIKYLSSAWSRDIVQKTRVSLQKLCVLHASVAGSASVADANEAAKDLRDGDLVFVDPPYSALQYSRFYHVLESVVSGNPGAVEGIGRYPSTMLRPQSSYSVKSLAAISLEALLSELSAKRVSVILTFPDHNCSNGLSGSLIKKMSSKYFNLEVVSVKSRFSTLGGSGLDCIVREKRGARRDASELILYLTKAKTGSGSFTPV